MINDCISKVCNIPVDLNQGDKSAYALAEESDFRSAHQKIEIGDIKSYLQNHNTLIDKWQQWSLNKRTTGYYLTLEKSYTVGKLNKDGKTVFKKDFTSTVDACAEFIYLEVSQILQLENET